VKRFFVTLVFLLGAAPAFVSADNLEDSYQNLQKAQQQKDAAQVKKLAAELHTWAVGATNAPAPPGAEEKKDWEGVVAHAKEIDLATEYALYVTAVQSPAETMIDLFSTLEQQNPKSKYLDAGYGTYLAAVARTKSTAQARALADKGLQSLPDNEDLLLFVADNAMTNKQTDRALTCATRLVTVLSKHPRPEGMAAAEWDRQQATKLGRGYWMAGVIHADRQLWKPADQELRSAVPLIKDNQSLLAAAYFYLGVANYQLGKLTLNKAQVLESVKFSEQAAAIQSPYAQQAWRNAQISKDEAAKMR
jgi:hypothetical protein